LTDIYKRIDELNIKLTDKTDALPTDLLDITGICGRYLHSIEMLYSSEVDNDKRLLIKVFKDIRGALYIHLAYHIKSLKKALNVIIKDLENGFGRDILSKATKVLDILDMADIDGSNLRFGKLKMRLFQSAEKLAGPDPMVMFFEGKDWEDHLFITIDQDPGKVGPIPGKTLHLKPEEISILVEKLRKYRLVFLTFWKSPEMTDGELKDLMANIDAGGVKELTC
jgi:hypothetical protein